MNITHYIGFDVHKKWIFYCTKTKDGMVVEEGKIQSERPALKAWAQQRGKARESGTA